MCRNHIHVSKNRLAKSGFPDRKPSLIETSLSVLCVGRLRSICWKSLLNSKLLLELHRRQVISCALIGSMCAARRIFAFSEIQPWSRHMPTNSRHCGGSLPRGLRKCPLRRRHRRDASATPPRASGGAKASQMQKKSPLSS